MVFLVAAMIVFSYHSVNQLDIREISYHEATVVKKEDTDGNLYPWYSISFEVDTDLIPYRELCFSKNYYDSVKVGDTMVICTGKGVLNGNLYIFFEDEWMYEDNYLPHKVADKYILLQSTSI